MDLTPIVLAHEQAFTIADVEIRPATREVVNAGSVTILEPRVMQLLVALHRADGGVVSKDDLAQLCWEGRIVGEDAINRVVSRLRAVADKDGGKRFRIETITKVGYRLIGGDSQAAPVEPGKGASQLASRRQLLIGAGVAAVAVAGSATLFVRQQRRLPAAAESLVADADQDLWAGAIDQSSNAIGKLRKAATIAPDAAPIWGRLAFAYSFAQAGAPVDQRSDLNARGLAARKRAFALDPDDSWALASWANSVPVFRNWYANEQAYRSALRKAPDQPALLVGLGYLLSQVGRAPEAADLVKKARILAPPSPMIDSRRINALWDTGLFDETEAAIDESLKLFPRHFGVWFSALYYRMYRGRAGEAVAMITDIGSRPIGIPEWNFEEVRLQATSILTRDPMDIRKALDVTLDYADRGTGFAENGATFAGFMGDFDRAFRILDALYFNRGFTMPDAYFAKEQGMYAGSERHTYNLFRQPLKALRRDPRFALLTHQLGLDDYWRRTNSRSLVIA